jgi:hypothetical protein
VQRRPHRPNRNPERGGDLPVVEVRQRVEHEHVPLPSRHLLESRSDQPHIPSGISTLNGQLRRLIPANEGRAHLGQGPILSYLLPPPPPQEIGSNPIQPRKRVHPTRVIPPTLPKRQKEDVSDHILSRPNPNPTSTVPMQHPRIPIKQHPKLLSIPTNQLSIRKPHPNNRRITSSHSTQGSHAPYLPPTHNQVPRPVRMGSRRAACRLVLRMDRYPPQARQRGQDADRGQPGGDPRHGWRAAAAPRRWS